MLKSSIWIKEHAEKFKLIEPFIPKSVRDGVISYGLGPYGYDIRLDHTYKKIRDNVQIIDPHNITVTNLDDANKGIAKHLLDEGITVEQIKHFGNLY